MWKMVVGFAVFAALALFVLMKSGGNIDMGGEKHDVTAGAHEPAAAAASDVVAPVDAPSAPAPGASQ